MNLLINYLETEGGYLVDKWVEHLFITIVSLIISITIALVLAIIASRPNRERLGNLIVSLSGALQAVPSIAFIAFAFLLMGIGPWAAISALAVYGIVPILFNGVSGLRSVNAKIKEAARGMGMTEGQILFKVELPLALPPIFAGIRSAAVIAVGTATISTAIGAGGLGEIIFSGLQMFDNSKILAGALPVSLTAIFFDQSIAILSRRITSPGIHHEEGV